MIYLDTSFLLPLFRQEATSDLVSSYLGTLPIGSLGISHWTRVEFASVIGREVRVKTLTRTQGDQLIESFDDFTQESLHLIAPTAADFNLAHAFVKNFSTKLRGPDALHLAIASNHQIDKMLSLDVDLLSAAKILKIQAQRGI